MGNDRMARGRKRIGVIGFDGVSGMDITGPTEVFATAATADGTSGRSPGAYEVFLLGVNPEPFRAESGTGFVPDGCLDDALGLDTVIVPGGRGLREPAVNAQVSSWLRAHACEIRRVCAVCTGIYALAPTGLLDGRRATTHWRFAEDVARRFPAVRMDASALFVKDGPFYTSGGVTAGIDLALALVEEDLGSLRALAVARELVVYLKRPGGQEQYSEPLRFQTRAALAAGFADLIAWILSHLQQDLSVEVLAARAGFSARHFTRRFAAAVGCTPKEFVERARLGEARERLVISRRTIDSIAFSVGFRSPDVFRRRFASHFGLTPREFRERFAPST